MANMTKQKGNCKVDYVSRFALGVAIYGLSHIQGLEPPHSHSVLYSSGQPKPTTFIVAERLVEIVQFL